MITAITTQTIKDIIDTHNEQNDLAPADVADLLSVPYQTVIKVLNGYEALVNLSAEDVEFLKKNKPNRPLYNAIIDLYGLESPFGRKPVQKKEPDPGPTKETPQRDVLEEIRKKRDYHKTRYWVLNELLEELERGE